MGVQIEVEYIISGTISAGTWPYGRAGENNLHRFREMCSKQNRAEPQLLEDGEKVGNEHIILPTSHAFLTLMEQK